MSPDYALLQWYHYATTFLAGVCVCAWEEGNRGFLPWLRESGRCRGRRRLVSNPDVTLLDPWHAQPSVEDSQSARLG